MATIQQLKSAAQQAIDLRRDWLINIAKQILKTPEPGFMEYKTARLVGDSFDAIGLPYRSGIALTGLRGTLTSRSPGPTIAVLGELDSLRVSEHPYADNETGAAHACGHHCQAAMMLGTAVGLQAKEVLDSLAGNVEFMAVPAEEFIDVEYRWHLHQEGKLGLMSGKQEFIRLGEFDDVDMAMMIHTSSSNDDAKFALGGTSNGHLVKYVNFIGRAAHAGGAPEHGINALQAATVALTALNAQRETLRNEDAVRLHGIMTLGGSATNSVPSDVRYEGRVRGRTSVAIDDANKKMDRCLRAGALALGGKVKIVTIPGYMPMINNQQMLDLFNENASELVGMSNVVVHPSDTNRGGSTDMGDISQIMPVIHPYTRAASGLGHGVDYLIHDYDQAVIKPAKAMAMTIIDLLYTDANKAAEVLAESPACMTKEQYLTQQRARLTEELYGGV